MRQIPVTKITKYLWPLVSPLESGDCPRVRSKTILPVEPRSPAPSSWAPSTPPALQWPELSILLLERKVRTPLPTPHMPFLTPREIRHILGRHGRDGALHPAHAGLRARAAVQVPAGVLPARAEEVRGRADGGGAGPTREPTGDATEGRVSLFNLCKYIH